MTIASMPARWRRWPSTSPAGPAPTMPICVRMLRAQMIAQEGCGPAIGEVRHGRVIARRADPVEGMIGVRVGMDFRPAGETLLDDLLRLARHVLVLFRNVQH